LVTHLTSLVLVDENGAAQEGLPGTRKVALPSPWSIGQESFLAEPVGEPDAGKRHVRLEEACHGSIKFDQPPDLAPEPSRAFVPPIAPEPSRADLSILARKIEWDAAPQLLKAGDLSALDREVALAIHSAAMIPEVVAFARQLSLDPVALVVGLVARSESLNSRSAARLAKAIFCDIAHEGLDHIAQMLGLKGGSNLTSGN